MRMILNIKRGQLVKDLIPHSRKLFNFSAWLARRVREVDER